MAIDQNYTKSILNEFCKADSVSLTIRDFEGLGYWIDGGEQVQESKFLNHMIYLGRENFIARADGGDGVGLKAGLHGDIAKTIMPLVLTDDGRRFLKG